MSAVGHTRRRVPRSRVLMWGGAGIAGALLLVLLGLGAGGRAFAIAGVALLLVCLISCGWFWLLDCRAERDLNEQLDLASRRDGRRGDRRRDATSRT